MTTYTLTHQELRDLCDLAFENHLTHDMAPEDAITDAIFEIGESQAAQIDIDAYETKEQGGAKAAPVVSGADTFNRLAAGIGAFWREYLAAIQGEKEAAGRTTPSGGVICSRCGGTVEVALHSNQGVVITHVCPTCGVIAQEHQLLPCACGHPETPPSEDLVCYHCGAQAVIKGPDGEFVCKACQAYYGPDLDEYEIGYLDRRGGQIEERFLGILARLNEVGFVKLNWQTWPQPDDLGQWALTESGQVFINGRRGERP